MRPEDVRSVIQPEFQDLVDTGMWPIHHVFGGVRNRRKCEKYGFLVCISPDVHDECHRHGDGGPALFYKKKCQEYWESHIGTRAEFIAEFGKNYLEGGDDL